MDTSNISGTNNSGSSIRDNRRSEDNKEGKEQKKVICDQCGIQFDYKKEGFVDAGFGCCKPCWEKLMQTLAG